MAGLNISTLSNYTDEHGVAIVNKMIAQGQTFKFVTIQPGIKSAQKINLLSNTLVVQANACGWSASGTNNMGQVTLTVNAKKINLPMCIPDAEAKSLQTRIQPGTAGDDTAFARLWADETVLDLQAWNEDYFWNDATYGIRKYVSTNSGSTVNLGTGHTAVTDANVISTVDTFKKRIPTPIKNRQPILFMGTDAFDTFIIALKNANLYHINPTIEANYGSYVYQYLGMLVVGTTGLDTSDEMYLTIKPNIYLGTDLLDEMDRLKIFYADEADEIRLSAKWKIGQTCLFPQFIVTKF